LKILANALAVKFFLRRQDCHCETISEAGPMSDAILVVNAGSSSMKFALFAQGATQSEQRRLFGGSVDGIGAKVRFTVPLTEAGQAGSDQKQSYSVAAENHEQALQIILEWLEQNSSTLKIIAAGHRVVHGGKRFSQAVRLDANVLDQLQALVELAPLHQPHALQAIKALMTQHPQLPQVACFDTAFHTTMPMREQRFALPQSLAEQGIRRYGFHGLSYAYISSVLPDYLADVANGRVVVAHLGHGVSLCALRDRQSLATTMSFTPLDGLPMGTRSGAIDPAIVLYLLQRGMTADAISDLLHHQSGLLGLSGISADMRELLSSDEPAAADAVDFFCYRISRELGSLAAALGGLDAMVFTGGIGEHAAPVRASICQMSTWLGLDIDVEANGKNALRISTDHSKVSVWVIPTDEEQVIARGTAETLFGN
jgi:acetate kinase